VVFERTYQNLQLRVQLRILTGFPIIVDFDYQRPLSLQMYKNISHPDFLVLILMVKKITPRFLLKISPREDAKAKSYRKNPMLKKRSRKENRVVAPAGLCTLAAFAYNSAKA
jgi:hypothetical protein